jgi:hypothetical protein
MQEHMLMCPELQHHRTEMANRICACIQENAHTNIKDVACIPLWFHTGSPTHELALVVSTLFLSLATYNKAMGSKGYIPMALPAVLHLHFGIANPTFLSQLLNTVLKEAFTAWKAHCSNLTNGQLWKEANGIAKACIQNGLT